MKGKKRGSKF